MKHGFAAAVIAMATVLGGVAGSPARAGDIIQEWADAKAPPAPELKPVTADSKTTALLLLDLIKPNCTNRPRCMASIPAMKKMLEAARAHGVLVIYSTANKATPADIVPDIAPAPGDPVVNSGVDKFYQTDLEKMLKDKGIQTVIVNGTAAYGAALYTGSAAAVRGFNVVSPVDGMTAETLYFEQISVWLLSHGTGGIGPKVTLTRSDMITFK